MQKKNRHNVILMSNAFIGLFLSSGCLFVGFFFFSKNLDKKNFDE